MATTVVSVTLSRTLYWSDVGSNPKIKNASMDGSHERTTIPYVEYTFVFTLDHSQQVLYWMNSSSGGCYYHTNYKLESSNVNGSGRRTVHNTSGIGSCSCYYYCRSQAIDFFGGAVYSYSTSYISSIYKTVVDDTPTVHSYDYVSNYMCSSSHTGMKVISHQRQVQGMYAHVTDSL